MENQPGFSELEYAGKRKQTRREADDWWRQRVTAGC